MKSVIILFCLVTIGGWILVCQCSDTSKSQSGPFGQKPPGNTPEIFAPGIISNPDTKEMGCTWMPDMKEFYFTRQGTDEDPRLWSIWYSKQINGEWTEPEIAGFSGKHIDVAPFITYDGKYMFIYRKSLTDTSITRGTWIIERKGDIWTESRFFVDAYMLTTADFDTFYCTIDTVAGAVNRQIAYMTYTDSEFSEKKPIEKQLNSPHFDAHSNISPKGNFILFDSDRPGSFNGLDIYVSFSRDNNEWSEAINLGENINRGQYSIPSMSPDGKYLFLNAKGDIYWVDATVIGNLKSPE